MGLVVVWIRLCFRQYRYQNSSLHFVEQGFPRAALMVQVNLHHGSTSIAWFPKTRLCLDWRRTSVGRFNISRCSKPVEAV